MQTKEIKTAINASQSCNRKIGSGEFKYYIIFKLIFIWAQFLNNVASFFYTAKWIIYT